MFVNKITFCIICFIYNYLYTHYTYKHIMILNSIENIIISTYTENITFILKILTNQHYNFHVFQAFAAPKTRYILSNRLLYLLVATYVLYSWYRYLIYIIICLFSNLIINVTRQTHVIICLRGWQLTALYNICIYIRIIVFFVFIHVKFIMKNDVIVWNDTWEFGY